MRIELDDFWYTDRAKNLPDRERLLARKKPHDTASRCPEVFPMTPSVVATGMAGGLVVLMGVAIFFLSLALIGCPCLIALSEQPLNRCEQLNCPNRFGNVRVHPS